MAKGMNITVADCYSEWKRMSKSEDVTLLLANRINHPIPRLHTLFADMLFEIIIGEEGSGKESDSAMFENS